MVAVAGDFLNCWGEDRGPWGEKAAEIEKGVETEGVAAAPCWACEGVLPCDSGYFPGVGVDMAADGGRWLSVILMVVIRKRDVGRETMLIQNVKASTDPLSGEFQLRDSA